MDESQDVKIQRICLEYIRKYSMDVERWSHTLLGQLHSGNPALNAGELPIVSIYFSPASWCVLTTKRVFGIYYGHSVEADAVEISETNFGNFKGYGDKQIEVVTIRTPTAREFRLEYETGKASMAPIYFFAFWKKYPVLDKLAS